MNGSQDSLYPQDWKQVAQKDFNRVKRNLIENDIESAGFFLQQSLEKYLKAFLLSKGWQLQKVHTLSTLLDYAKEFNPKLESFRALCERVTDYYFVERYPQLIPSELTSDDIERDLKEAEDFIKVMFGEEKIGG